MDIALLALRLVVGLTFAAHGAQTLFGAFGGDGIEGTARIFEQLVCARASPTRCSEERRSCSAASCSPSAS